MLGEGDACFEVSGGEERTRLVVKERERSSKIKIFWANVKSQCEGEKGICAHRTIKQEQEKHKIED